MRSSYKIALLGLSLCLSLQSIAQKPKTGCIDVDIQGQADGIKLSLTKQGNNVFQEGMFNMTSMEPTAIAVKMMQGVPYQLIFVGSENSHRMIMEIFDGKNKKVDEKIERGSNNSIVYTYTPPKTDIYLVTLYQKRGQKDMCGYFGVMMKGVVPAMATANEPAAKPVEHKRVPVQTKRAETVKTVTPAPVKKTTPVAAKPAPASAKPGSIDNMPANQRPNPNRTRATREAQQGK